MAGNGQKRQQRFNEKHEIKQRLKLLQEMGLFEIFDVDVEEVEVWCNREDK